MDAFSLRSQSGLPYTNFTYCVDSVWSPPDSVCEDYTSIESAISISDDDVVHAAIASGITFYGDIVYTYLIPINSVDERAKIVPWNHYFSVYPNPFNSHITISYILDKKSKVNLYIYNSLGQVINIIENNILPPGEHLSLWNGTGRDGSNICSGIYFIRLEVDDVSSVKKVNLLK